MDISATGLVELRTREEAIIIIMITITLIIIIIIIIINYIYKECMQTSADINIVTAVKVR